MSTLTDYTDALAVFVPGTHPVEASTLSAMKTKAVTMAVNRYSKDKPLVVVEDIDGDGGFDYALAGLTSWEDDFSVLRQVEYPVDDTEKTPDILQEDAWTVYETPAGRYLRFLEDRPVATEDMRLTYTARHTCTGAGCSVEEADEAAVQALAAHFYCKLLAAAYALDQDSTIDADSVDHGGRSRKFGDLAKQYLTDYNAHMGIVPGKPKAASVTKDQDKDASWAGDKLTHKRRYR